MNTMRSFVRKALPAMACLLAAMPSLAAPYAPANDDTVVETVRAGAVRTGVRRAGQADEPREDALALQRLRLLRQLQTRWRQATGPAKDRVALDYARAAIEQARLEGDPRWLGAAQAALGGWWTQEAPPDAARLLRGTILQSLHDFNAALKDLDALVDARQTPEAIRLQARFTRASVLQVQGRWRDAAQDCQMLASPAPLESMACLAELRSLAGDTAFARDTLSRLAQSAGSPAQQAWLSLMQAELAERMAQPSLAEALYRQALQAAPDSYTLGAYADFLLDAGRVADVERLLQGRQQVDALLLRLALAWQRMGPTRAGRLQQAVDVLQASFDAARLRGERVHMREEARFELLLKRRPQAALSLAQANWAVQKEPADARLLMDAALAAPPGTGLPVLRSLHAWLRQQGLADARLSAIGKLAASSWPGRAS